LTAILYVRIIRFDTLRHIEFRYRYHSMSHANSKIDERPQNRKDRTVTSSIRFTAARCLLESFGILPGIELPRRMHVQHTPEAFTHAKTSRRCSRATICNNIKFSHRHGVGHYVDLQVKSSIIKQKSRIAINMPIPTIEYPL
jgi:hypothetical protein